MYMYCMMSFRITGNYKNYPYSQKFLQGEKLNFAFFTPALMSVTFIPQLFYPC